MTQTWACSRRSMPSMNRPSRRASADRRRCAGVTPDHRGLRRSGGGAHLPGFDLDLGRDLRHSGNGGVDGFEIALGQPDRGLAHLLELLAVVGARPHQDVVHPQPLDHRQRFLLGAGSDREHGDHRADSEHDPEHGQSRAHLVRRQVRERHGECVARLHPPPMKAASALRSPPTRVSLPGSASATLLPASRPEATTARPRASALTWTGVRSKSCPMAR